MKNACGLHDLISRQLRIVMVQLVVGVCVSAASNDGSASLFSGSLTWSVNPDFALGNEHRVVEFTLDTSFEMDLRYSASVCSSTVTASLLKSIYHSDVL